MKGQPFLSALRENKKVKYTAFRGEDVQNRCLIYDIWTHMICVIYHDIRYMAVVQDTYDGNGGGNSGKDLINHFIENN